MIRALLALCHLPHKCPRALSHIFIKRVALPSTNKHVSFNCKCEAIVAVPSRHMNQDAIAKKV